MEKILPPTLALIATGFLSLVIGIYLEKFRSRLTILKYELFFQPLATAAQNAYWGNIEVLHNGRPINHLSFITVYLKNDSNRDLQEVNVDIRVDQNSRILAQSGFYEESGTPILLEQGYFEHYLDVVERNEIDVQTRRANPNHVTPAQLSTEIDLILTNKKFHLPVLNRRSEITLNILTENIQGQTPQVSVSVLHKSVKVIKQADKAQEDRELGLNMILWGLLAFVIGVLIIQRMFTEATIPLVLTGILGIAYLFIGLLIYRAIKLIKYMLA
jgi:hypothetical protein